MADDIRAEDVIEGEWRELRPDRRGFSAAASSPWSGRWDAHRGRAKLAQSVAFGHMINRWQGSGRLTSAPRPAIAPVPSRAQRTERQAIEQRLSGGYRAVSAEAFSASPHARARAAVQAAVDDLLAHPRRGPGPPRGH